MNPNHRTLIFAGIMVPAVFWVTLVLCGALMAGYSHSANLVSELGAEGTDTREIFALGLLLCSALCLAFVTGLLFECRRLKCSPLPVVILLAYSFSIAGAAVYPMPHPLHGVLGSPSVLLIFSPLMAMVFWRQGPSLKGLIPVSLFCFLVFALGFLVFFPSVLNESLGLKQRFFHIGWSIWFIYLSLGFSGILNRVVPAQFHR